MNDNVALVRENFAVDIMEAEIAILALELRTSLGGVLLNGGTFPRFQLVDEFLARHCGALPVSVEALDHFILNSVPHEEALLSVETSPRRADKRSKEA